jgi:transglutaminase-like putative cysteine protease
MAADLLRPGGGPLDVAERICTAVHATLTYQHGVTNVGTTAAEAIAAGRGVCQDAAHIMVALCRLAQLPARYVSGHLLGQGGTHAWVEVIVPHDDAAIAVPFDPCHGRRTDNRYLTVAVGRDYADVAPTSGSYVGPPGGRLTGTRRVGVIAVDTAFPSLPPAHGSVSRAG